MRLFILELKRMLKTRITWILLAAALLLSVAMAWLPITFAGYTYEDENGQEIRITGLPAIKKTKEAQEKIAGEITEETLKAALTDYQKCVELYGETSDPDFPQSAYNEYMLPYAMLRQKIRETYADPNSGAAPDLLTMNPEQLNHFYEQCVTHLADLMKMEQKQYPDAQQTAREMYEKVKQPFLFYPGFSTNSLDYQMLYLFLLMLICTVISAPVFSSEYQTGADDILRCTKHGRIRLGEVKILSAVLLSTVSFGICMAIFAGITGGLYGAQSLKTSLQLLYSSVNLPNLDAGGMMLFIAGTGLLTVAATVCLTLFLSSKCRTVQSSLILAFGFCVLPIVIGIMTGSSFGNLLRSILPSAGAALNSSLLYEAVDFKFLHIFGKSIWIPHVMITAAAVEIPLFAGMAAYSYCRHGRK